MGRLIDGDWKTDAELTENDRKQRQDTFRERIHSGSRFPPEPGRYHLYIARACPWAHGAVLVRALLGLEDALSMDVVDPYRGANGWQFSPEKSGCTPDSLHGSDFLHEVYTEADPEFTGRVTTPVLWDRVEGTIVNNESIEIMEMLATAFGGHSDGADLYPEGKRDRIDAVVEELYEPINQGVYTAGFADSQAVYEEAVRNLFDALDYWEEVLADQRFLVGDALTLADLRLFPALVRFDPVYHTHFKCTLQRLVEYPNLWGYTRDIYQHDGVPATVNLDHIKEHYYQSHTAINPTGFVPVGPDIDFTAPHGRG
ncbi:glutathione S-transferase family protein [Haloarcula pellucida]|uniref:Glutathione-dependent reductase n=1 Tax=Haloarcula pellucida TaxID=1427151 RepID=A0A830GLE9_9EURY|nr:glutathione S-transferase family protein [Halomicroarcula pellucida]MBX0349960.1 glutathione S-transferase family protein [Halomicroarcula pellucida]GGN95230.1 glutathione-dependent reductase [Halomicroarcula pellucida]